jgi:hypothetical protein
MPRAGAERGLGGVGGWLPHQIAKAGSAGLETEGPKPLHSAALFSRSMHPGDDWPTRSRSMMRYRGISISNFRIPNSVWLMEDWGIVINQKTGCGRL